MSPPRKRMRFDSYLDTLLETQGVPVVGMGSYIAQGDFLELDDLSSEINASADDSLIEIAEDDFIELDDLAILDLNAYGFGIQSKVIEKDFLGLDILDHQHFISKDIDNSLLELTNTLGCPNLINSGIPNDMLENNVSKLPHLISDELPERVSCSGFVHNAALAGIATILNGYKTEAKLA